MKPEAGEREREGKRNAVKKEMIQRIHEIKTVMRSTKKIGGKDIYREQRRLDGAKLNTESRELRGRKEAETGEATDFLKSCAAGDRRS